MEPVTPAWSRSHATCERLGMDGIEPVTPAPERRGTGTEQSGTAGARVECSADVIEPQQGTPSPSMLSKVIVLDEPLAHLMCAVDTEEEGSEEEITEPPPKRVRTGYT